MLDFKDGLGWLLLVAVILAIPFAVFGGSYASKKFHNVTTPISVSEVEPGVKCAIANTNTGVALSCWKE